MLIFQCYFFISVQHVGRVHLLNPQRLEVFTVMSVRMSLFSVQRLTVIGVFFLAILPFGERNSEVLKDTARRKLFTKWQMPTSDDKSWILMFLLFI